MTQEEFNKIGDLRRFLLAHPDQQMVIDSCLHFLGDDVQNYWHKKLQQDQGDIKDVRKEITFYVSRNLQTAEKRYLYILFRFPEQVAYINYDHDSQIFATYLTTEFNKKGLLIDLINQMRVDFKGYIE